MIPFYLTESPKYLYEHGKFDEARESLDHIAAANGVDKHYIAFDRETPEFAIVEMDSVISFDSRGAPTERSRSPVSSSSRSWFGSQLFKDPMLRNNLMILIIQWTCCSFNHYMMLYQLKYFKGNIFYNTIGVCMARNVSITCGYYLLSVYGVRKTFYRCYTASLSAVICIWVL